MRRAEGEQLIAPHNYKEKKVTRAQGTGLITHLQLRFCEARYEGYRAPVYNQPSVHHRTRHG